MFVCLFVCFTANSIGEPVLLEQYVAVKDYKKQYHNDISLTKGYTMGVIEKHESGKKTHSFSFEKICGRTSWPDDVFHINDHHSVDE